MDIFIEAASSGKGTDIDFLENFEVGLVPSKVDDDEMLLLI